MDNLLQFLAEALGINEENEERQRIDASFNINQQFNEYQIQLIKQEKQMRKEYLQNIDLLDKKPEDDYTENMLLLQQHQEITTTENPCIQDPEGNTVAMLCIRDQVQIQKWMLSESSILLKNNEGRTFLYLAFFNDQMQEWFIQKFQKIIKNELINIIIQAIQFHFKVIPVYMRFSNASFIFKCIECNYQIQQWMAKDIKSDCVDEDGNTFAMFILKNNTVKMICQDEQKILQNDEQFLIDKQLFENVKQINKIEQWMYHDPTIQNKNNQNIIQICFEQKLPLQAWMCYDSNYQDLQGNTIAMLHIFIKHRISIKFRHNPLLQNCEGNNIAMLATIYDYQVYDWMYENEEVFNQENQQGDNVIMLAMTYSKEIEDWQRINYNSNFENKKFITPPMQYVLTHKSLELWMIENYNHFLEDFNRNTLAIICSQNGVELFQEQLIDSFSENENILDQLIRTTKIINNSNIKYGIEQKTAAILFIEKGIKVPQKFINNYDGSNEDIHGRTAAYYQLLKNQRTEQWMQYKVTRTSSLKLLHTGSQFIEEWMIFQVEFPNKVNLENKVCIICLDVQKLYVETGCEHDDSVICVECFKEYRKHNNTCPICKVHWFDKLNRDPFQDLFGN